MNIDEGLNEKGLGILISFKMIGVEVTKIMCGACVCVERGRGKKGVKILIWPSVMYIGMI